VKTKDSNTSWRSLCRLIFDDVSKDCGTSIFRVNSPNRVAVSEHKGMARIWVRKSGQAITIVLGYVTHPHLLQSLTNISVRTPQHACEGYFDGLIRTKSVQERIKQTKKSDWTFSDFGHEPNRVYGVMRL